LKQCQIAYKTTLKEHEGAIGVSINKEYAMSYFIDL